ncbi:MAG: hypothetical protein AAF525_11510, partial [Pseudomonadota bacterium]
TGGAGEGVRDALLCWGGAGEAGAGCGGLRTGVRASCGLRVVDLRVGGSCGVLVRGRADGGVVRVAAGDRCWVNPGREGAVEAGEGAEIGEGADP